MPAPRLAEASVTLTRDYIRSNISAALSAVRSDRADSAVTTEAPTSASYFIYKKAKAYKAPAIFIICEDFDFKITEHAANFIEAVAKVNVSVVVEDRNAELLTIKCWRYQSALHQLLAQQPLVSTDGKVKLTVIVKKEMFSELYSTLKNADSPEAAFRKEVLLECEIYHRENY